MSERPILFSAPMVRAILAGTKTQTRRVVKPQPDDEGLCARAGKIVWEDTSGREYRCPYGARGDELWVRETACAPDGKTWIYAADWSDAELKKSDTMRRRYPELAAAYPDSRWRPSIHMPRSASRIQLRVTSVRVERLQAISEDDARAEGIHEFKLPGGSCFGCNPTPAKLVADTARDAFGLLWQSINAKRAPWSSNPWVWVVSFERVRP